MDLVCQFLLVTVYCLAWAYVVLGDGREDRVFEGLTPELKLKTSVWLPPQKV